MKLLFVITNAALGYYWIAKQSDYTVGLFCFAVAFYVLHAIPVEATSRIKKEKRNGKAIQNRPR